MQSVQRQNGQAPRSRCERLAVCIDSNTMSQHSKQLILFTDLDGCLLNKHDYDWSPAAATLETLRRLGIPVVMNSSKTIAEMTQLADEMMLSNQTFISENGAVIRWGRCQTNQAESIEVVGAQREGILTVLQNLKPTFQFRSFNDLGLQGVIEATQLPEAKAQLAIQRQGTEPLLWDDSDEQRQLFETHLSSAGLTLTKGGRFWHVAGPSTKGKAMQIVADRIAAADRQTVTVGIGDSPIDQSMLNCADIPIGIPTATGLGVTVSSEAGIVASQMGALGWAESVNLVLSRLHLQP